MLRTFHAVRRLRRAAESHLHRITRRLASGQVASVEARWLKRLEVTVGEGGSKPQLLFEDPRRERYLLKVGDPELLAAEIAAYELRSLGRRPAVPARLVTVELDGATVQGVLKPYLELDGDRELAPDTTTWTPLQRAVLLMDHAWEWFLDNLDTNTSQFALFGPEGVPVNLDWDRSFCSEGHAELSRFTKYKRTIPNARTFLYADYVEGRIELPFSLLHAEARRIRDLPAAKVRAALSRYAEVRFPDPQAREEFVARMLARRRRIELEFQRFVRDLVAERRDFVGARSGLKVRLHALSAVLWKSWQLVLHHLTRGPVGAFCRSVLRFARGRRHLPSARVESTAGAPSRPLA
jgi:hypothetical protein